MPDKQKTYTPPPYLQPNSEISISLTGDSASSTICATVIQHFPFTWSQVVLCEFIAQTPSPSCLLHEGSRFIVKIFDPRYHPRAREDAPQWTYDAEREAYPRHQGKLTRWCSALGPELIGLENWEEFYYLTCKTLQRSEVEAYQCLAPVQGSFVPTLYGHGDLDLSVHDPQRSVHPPAILIEYIANAVTLKELDIRVLTRPVIQSLLDAVRRIEQLGVCHWDLNLGNYLFTPPHKPTRAVLIDWADAPTRQPEYSDQEWEECVAFNNNWRETKHKIAWKYEQASLPVPEEVADWNVWPGVNE